MYVFAVSPVSMHVHDLGEDVLSRVFSYLDVYECSIASGVCRSVCLCVSGRDDVESRSETWCMQQRPT